MKRYIAYMYTGMAGTDMYEAIIADSVEEAEQIAAEMANDNASSYGIEQGMDEDDEMYCYADVGASVEEYDPAKHDCNRSGGGSFEDDFNFLEKII